MSAHCHTLFTPARRHRACRTVIALGILVVGGLRSEAAPPLKPIKENCEAFFQAKWLPGIPSLFTLLCLDVIGAPSPMPIDDDGSMPNAAPTNTRFGAKQGTVVFGPPTPGTRLARLGAQAVPAQGIGAGDGKSDVNGRFLYVSLGGSDKIAAYRVDPATGERSNVPGAPFGAGKVPAGIAVHPSNMWLFVAHAVSEDIYSYRLQPVTGALTRAVITPAGSVPQSVAVDPAGQYLFVTTLGDRRLTVYKIDTASGALTAVGLPQATGNAPSSVFVHPTGAFVYLTAGGRVEGYRVALNGTLTPIPGSPFGRGAAVRLAITINGDFLYTADAAANTVSGFTIDSATGALTEVPGSPIASGLNPTWIVADATGRFVIVASPGALVGGANSLSAYAVNSDTGTLSHLSGSPFGTPGTTTPDVVTTLPAYAYEYAMLGTDYQATFASAGGVMPYAYRIASGTLPPGLALDAASGRISGVPASNGTYDFVLEASDAAGATRQRAMFIVVNETGLPPGADLTPNRYAVEFNHARFGHYFTTTDIGEIDKLDDGTFAGWQRTGQNFKTYALGTPDTGDVCRFFSTAFGEKSSHFYTPYAAECETVKASASWMFEGTVYGERLPSADGVCQPGTLALFRLYNNGIGGAPNHRFTTDAAVRAATISSGWIPEGYGPLGVIACVPP